jgi:hypothetical protein
MCEENVHMSGVFIAQRTAGLAINPANRGIIKQNKQDRVI